MSASKGGLTVSSNCELTVSGQKRDLMIQAAMAYDETQSTSPIWRTNSI
jgi:hypothetical protein